MDNERLALPGKEPVNIQPPRRHMRRFLAFLLCSSILLAAFAVSGVIGARGDGEFWQRLGSFWKRGEDEKTEEPPKENGTTDEEIKDEPDENEEERVPPNAIPIISKDLSVVHYSENYIHNETAYRPNVAELKKNVAEGTISFDPADGPVVLILHTHATEAYAPSGVGYLTGELGREIYSEDPSRNVTSAGRALCEALNQNGVPAIICEDNHGENGSLQNSYAKAADCIRRYLEKYPTIQYVIDVHRDGILDGDGGIVRTLAQGMKEPTAQVMAVVGSDCNGTLHPYWQSNLSLALCLNDRLGNICQTLARPVSLRNASYNQELVPCALLLEIGSAGNTAEEAIRAAQTVGAALARLITRS